MATVNLAPDTEYLIAARRRQRLLFALATIIAVVVGIFWLALISARASTNNQIDESNSLLQSVELEIAKLETIADRIQSFENRLQALNQLLDNHITWSPVLQEIERLMPPPIVLENLSMSANSSNLEFSGNAPNLDQLSQALASLENEPQHTTLFSGAKLNSVQQDVQQGGESGESQSSGYSFGVTYNYNPDVLKIRKN